MAYKQKNNPFKGGYHKGQVGDAKTEEMNDNIATGKGPAKPKGMMDARPKSIKRLDRRKPHPDSDDHIGAVPTFRDHIGDAMNNKKNKKK